MASKELTTSKPSKFLTFDGWKNILTGLGMSGKDKRTGADIDYARMDQRTAELLYAGDDMAAKIVNTLPEEMIREGFEIKHDGKDFPTLNSDIMNILDDLGAIAKIEEGLKWGRMYGGAGTIMGVDDGQEANEPINYENITAVDFLNNMNRWELQPIDIQKDPSEKSFGMPRLYRIQPVFGGGQALDNVHHSRMLRWGGAGLPRRLQIENNYWDDSVLNRVWNVLRNFHASHDSVANLLQDFAQAVYKIKNLTEMIAMGKDELVEKRLALVDRTRSVVNAIVLEEGEDFDRKVTALTGLPETIKMVNQRLVQASGLPHTIMLGESPSGLGATGNSEKSDWYDYVARQQETCLIPQLTQLIKIILLSKSGPTKGIEPKNWRIEAMPLQQQTLKEKLETRKLQSDIDKTYIDSSVLSPIEVAKNRFGGDEFNYETKLDLGTDREPETEDPEEEIEGEDTNVGFQTDGGPGSRISGNNTKLIDMPHSEYVSVGTRKSLLDNVQSKPSTISMASIVKVGQMKYVPKKLGQMVKDWEKVKAKPIAVLKVGDEYHVIDGHHRFLAAKQVGEKNINVNVYERTKKDN